MVVGNATTGARLMPPPEQAMETSHSKPIYAIPKQTFKQEMNTSSLTATEPVVHAGAVSDQTVASPYPLTLPSFLPLETGNSINGPLQTSAQDTETSPSRQTYATDTRTSAQPRNSTSLTETEPVQEDGAATEPIPTSFPSKLEISSQSARFSSRMFSSELMEEDAAHLRSVTALWSMLSTLPAHGNSGNSLFNQTGLSASKMFKLQMSTSVSMEVDALLPRIMAAERLMRSIRPQVLATEKKLSESSIRPMENTVLEVTGNQMLSSESTVLDLPLLKTTEEELSMDNITQMEPSTSRIGNTLPLPKLTNHLKLSNFI